MPSPAPAAFREAVGILCQPTGDSAARAAADAWLRGLKKTEEGLHTLLNVVSTDYWGQWSPQERMVAASELFGAACKSGTAAGDAEVAPLAASFWTAVQSNEVATALALARTLVLILARSQAVPEGQLLPALAAALAPQPAQGTAMLRVLCCVPEIITLSRFSVHPARREGLLAGLRQSSQVAATLAPALRSDAPPEAQHAALDAITAWCTQLNAIPSGLGEAELSFVASAAAAVGSSDAAVPSQTAHAGVEALAALLGSCTSATPSEMLQVLFHETHRVLRVLCHQESSQQALAAAVPLAAAATTAATAAGPIEHNQFADYIGVCLLCMLDIGNADVRLGALGVWDEWLSSAATSSFNGPESRKRIIPSVGLLDSLRYMLTRCVELPPNLPTSALTADARDLPDAVLEVRREVSDTVKLVAAALGPMNALEGCIKSTEAAQKEGFWMPIESCLYVMNILPKRKEDLGDLQNEILEKILRVAAPCIVPAAPKMAGTALTLLGGLATPLGQIFTVSGVEVEPEGCWRALGAAVTAILQALGHRNDPKLCRNAATAISRLTGSQPLSTILAVCMPLLQHKLMAWYAADVNLDSETQGRHAAAAAEGLGLGEISTREFVMRALCDLGGGAMRATLLGEHCRKAEGELTEGRPAAAAAHLSAVATLLMPGEVDDGDKIAEMLLHASVSGCTELEVAALAAAKALTVAAPPTAPACVQTMIRCAQKNLQGALEALATLAEGLGADAANGQLTAAAVVELGAPVAAACADPQNTESDATFAAYLKLLGALAGRWPAAAADGTASDAVKAAQTAAALSWDRGVAEAGITLSAAVLENTSSGEVAVGALHALLTGACGGNPPYALPPIAEAVHAAWLRFDADTFASWLSAAMAQPMAIAGGAPWVAWAPEARQRALTELLADMNRGDAKRFKRMFKVMCGGKKKGADGRPPQR